MLKKVWLGLGGNVGDRSGHIRKALEALRGISEGPVSTSKIYETAPVGPGQQGKYLNLCASLSTRLNPRQLLEFCQELEQRLGRVPRGRWEPREIDIDILLVDQEILHENDLILPHPGLAKRQFVLTPLADLDANLIPPGFQESVSALLTRLRAAEGAMDIVEYSPKPQGAARTLPESMRYVAIEGVIGAGKTTMVKLLSERLGCQPLFEEFDNNPFLSDFYRDRSRFAFQTQVFFLLSRFRHIQEHFQQQDLLHPQVVSDYMFAKDRIFATQNLDENEMGLYQKLSGLLERELPRPDYVIYLQADTKTLLNRVRERDRPYERNIDEAYMESLNQAYNSYFHYYNASPLLIINTNHVDFVRSPSDLNMLLDQILKVRDGTAYFSPGVQH